MNSSSELPPCDDCAQQSDPVIMSRRALLTSLGPVVAASAIAPYASVMPALGIVIPPEPSDLVKESPLLMALLSSGAPQEEMERWAQGAQHLKEVFFKIPFYAQRGEKGGFDYWVDLFRSCPNSWPPDHFSEEAIARDQAKVTEEDLAEVKRLSQRSPFEPRTPAEVEKIWRVSIATRGYTRPIFGRMLLPKSPHDIHLEILREWFSGDDGFVDYEAAAETLANQTDEQIADAIGSQERNNPDFDRDELLTVLQHMRAGFRQFCRT